MRFLTPILFAGVLSLGSLHAFAADAVPPPPPAQEVAPAAMAAAASDAMAAPTDAVEAPRAASQPAAPGKGPSEAAAKDSQTHATSPADPASAAALPAVVDPAPTQAEPAPPAPVQVVTARIDPELALRLSLLEKTMLAQTAGQNQIYTETTKLLMFFGTACVAMGLIAMVAAVFLMNRTLASVSAITAHVAHAPTQPALTGGTAALIPGASPAASGFEKVQASGQRFQNRMTSLEERLEELEHLAGQAPSLAPTANGVESAPATELEAAPSEGPTPRGTIPVAAILVRKAETLMNLGKLDEAMSTLEEAGNHGGDVSEVHLARGRVLEKQGRLGDALHAYDLAATSDERNTAALLMKAGVLNRQERFDEALSCYERALAVHRAGA